MLLLPSVGPHEVILLPTKLRNKKGLDHTNSMLLRKQHLPLSFQLSEVAKSICYDTLRTTDVESYTIAFSREHKISKNQ